jgi:hypothetical protein
MIWPNPAHEIFTLQFPERGYWKIILQDVARKVLLQENTFGSSAGIDLRSFSAGIYLVTLEGKTRKFSQKIIKN